MKISFGIDVGGTNIKIGKFSEHKLIKKYSVPTDEIDVTKQLINEINKEINNDQLVKIGVGIPGPVVDGVVLGAQNINWFERVNLKKILEDKFKCDVVVYNDANAASLGEFNYGSGKEYQSIVFITLGTGIGGGIIINGNLLEGATGSSGEIGHINLEHLNGRNCSCGLSGCFEQYASATGIMKTAAIVNKKFNDLSCKELFQLAEEKDLDALKVLEITIDYLGLGIANICNVLNPECVIIGGGVSNGLAPYMEMIIEKFNKYAFFSVRNTKIKLSKLKNDAGIYGLS